ncbi:MAG: histidine kinase [Verrucomicrobium sp.]|nr:sensor histidine kinase [Verrucomicrobium sp.]
MTSQNSSGDKDAGGIFNVSLPVRLTAPLLVLLFGVAATWFNYTLARDANLARNLAEVRQRAGGVVARLAAMSERLLSDNLTRVLQLDLSTMLDVPELVSAGVVDSRNVVLADSTSRWIGFPVSRTPLAPAGTLIRPVRQVVIEIGENAERVYAACPFNAPGGGVGWALVELDRRPAMAGARADAQHQFYWISAAMALLSFMLWAVLHFGYASRLAMLAKGIHAWGAGRWDPKGMPGGSDEVGRLAEDFTTMATRLQQHELEQLRLEREVLNISESERRRIGHDLHDSLGQRLTAASMTVNAMLDELHSTAPAMAERGDLVAQQLREAIAEARSLSHGLAPVSLEADGLMNALEELATSVSRHGKVRCILDCPQPVHLDSVETATHLFRMAQEAVNNALKHATATEIRIGLEMRDSKVILEVDDDGVGLEETATSHGGLGMRVMAYRARLIGGDLQIGPAPAGGTRVRCEATVKPTA